MKKISIMIIAVLICLFGMKLYVDRQRQIYFEVAIIVAEDDNVTYQDGMILETDTNTGKVTQYTVKEFMKRSD